MRKFFAVSIVTSALSAASFGYLDQVQHSNTIHMAGFGQPDLAQSFKQFAISISGAGIFLREDVGVGEFGDITISLWDNLPNASGNMLATGTVTGVTAGMWADVFWSDVFIPHTTHYLVFESTNPNLGIAGDIANPYADGQVFANAGFGSFPDYDYTFHTHTNVLPEPASFAALAVGGAIVMRRRRRRVS